MLFYHLVQNPLPYLARFAEADVLTSTDQVIPTVSDDRLDIWQQGEDYSCLLVFGLVTCCCFVVMHCTVVFNTFIN